MVVKKQIQTESQNKIIEVVKGINKLALMTHNINKCARQSCAEEFKMMQDLNDKYYKKVEKLLHKKQNNQEYLSQMIALNKQKLESEERQKMFKCQISKCKKDTNNLLNVLLETQLKQFNNNKQHPLYKTMSEYKKMLKKGKITPEELRKIDKELLGTKFA
jgi:deoxyribodipyrimidine photolyase